MNQPIAVIGDVHGNVTALAGLLQTIEGMFDHLVFVGDYVNRGPDSAAVIQLLIDQSEAGTELFCIAGNHDSAFLKCLEEGKLFAFLRIGGAATINSYISTPEPDVLTQLRRSVPRQHVNFLRSLRRYYQDDELLVTHGPDDTPESSQAISFHAFGHVPQVSLVPKITKKWAAIDTGCGTLPKGKLTCLFWPTLKVIQVDWTGRKI